MGGGWRLLGFWDLTTDSEILYSAVITTFLIRCCLSSGCYNKDTIDWVAWTTNVSHTSGGRKSKVMVLADPVYGEGPLPGSQTTFSLCPHKAGRSLGSSSSHRATNPIMACHPVPPPWAHLNLITYQSSLLQIRSHWGLDLNICIWGHKYSVHSRWLFCPVLHLVFHWIFC